MLSSLAVASGRSCCAQLCTADAACFGLVLQPVVTTQPRAVQPRQMAGLRPDKTPCRFLPLNIPCACLLQGKGHARPALRSVLLVGNPSLPLKGFDVAINALAAINQVLPLHVTWVCQNQPNATLVPTLTGSGLCISLYINPSQVSQKGIGTYPEPDCCAAMSCTMPFKRFLWASTSSLVSCEWVAKAVSCVGGFLVCLYC